MPKRIAHILEEKWRSDDIRTAEHVDFSSLLLPDDILQGLLAAGFKYPSPIQLQAIPVTRIGKDAIIQAKSGTGKTIVFAVAALSVLLKGSKHPQVLIMVPTREIAYQITQVIKSITSANKDIKCQYFIGGQSSEEDVQRLENCQIVVGTPGRIKFLIMNKILRTSGIRLFVLDEADRLQENSYSNDIEDIFRSLPRDKQIIATSATFKSELKRMINKYFREPVLIRLNKKKIGLLGMVHYYREIPVSNMPVLAYRLKLKVLAEVLRNVKFGQCLVFCNMVSRVENLCVEIKNMGFSTTFISSAREQVDRLKAIEMLKRFKCKVLVSSDISARGIDAEKVDLVINFDLPLHLETYFHRVGRAGRYGSKCASVTFYTSDEIDIYMDMQKIGDFESHYLPMPVPSDLISKGPPESSDDESMSTGLYNDEDLNKKGEAEQKKTNDFIDVIQLNGKNAASKSSSDVDSDPEDGNENGNSQQEKISGVIDGICLNGKNVVSKSSSDSVSYAEDLKENGNAQQKNTKLFDLSSNPASSDYVLNSNQYVELESSKSDPSTFRKRTPQKDITEVIAAVEENSKLNVNGSNTEELCVNDELVGGKLDQQNCVTSVIENPKNGLSIHIQGLKQNTDTNSYLTDLESGPEKSFKEKINNDKLLVMNNESSISKNLSNPISKELINSVITFIEKYEKNEDFSNCSTSYSIQSSQSINVELKDNAFSPVSLMSLRSNLGQFYYNTYKNFIVNIPEVWIKEIAPEYRSVRKDNQVLEIESQNDLKEIVVESKLPDSNLNLQQPLFSTPKTEGLIRSDEESNSSDENRLAGHFNSFLNMNSKEENYSDTGADIMINSTLATLLLDKESVDQLSCSKELTYKSNGEAAINDEKSDSNLNASIEVLYDSKQQRVEIEEIVISDAESDICSDTSVELLCVSRKQGIKGKKMDIAEPFVNKNTIPGQRSNAGSYSDISVNGNCTMDMLDEAYNKDRAESYHKEMADENAIVNNADSFQYTRRRGKRGGRRIHQGYKDNDESFDTFVNKVVVYAKGKQNDPDCSKDAKNMSKSPQTQRADKSIKPITKVNTKKHVESPSSTSAYSREGVVEPQKEVGRITQNGTNEVANIKSSKPSISKTKTSKGNAQNKITYYYSETESEVDQYSEESNSSIQNHKKNKTLTRTDSGCRTELINRLVEKKTVDYDSESSSSETDSNCDQHSKVCDFNSQDRYNVKRNHRNDETGPFGYGYSNDTLNPACIRPSSASCHSSPHISDPYNRPCSQQSQNHGNRSPSCVSNPYNRPCCQQIHNHGNQSVCYSSPSCISNPYNRPCCQQSQNHGNQSASYSNYQMHPPCDVSGFINNQCSRQSQNCTHQAVRRSCCQMPSTTNGSNPNFQRYPLQIQNHRCSAGFSNDNFNFPQNVCPSISHVQSIHETGASHNDFNPCVEPSRHPCHPPNESCQSPACAAWYDIFCKHLQLCKQPGYF